MTPGDAVAEAMGAGKKSMRWWRGMAMLQAPATLVLAGWLIWEINTEPTVLPYVIPITEETKVLGTIRAREWPKGGALYADVARRWIWTLRSRPVDDTTNVSLKLEAQRMSDIRSWERIDNMLKKEEAGRRKDSGIEISYDISSTPREVGTNKGHDYAIVDVEWCERAFGRSGGFSDMAGFHAVLTIVRRDPANTGELEANPLGLFVRDYAFQATGPCKQTQVAETKK